MPGLFGNPLGMGMDINQLTAILQNPFVMNMVQQVLSNPEMLQQVRILFPLSLSLSHNTQTHLILILILILETAHSPYKYLNR
jgi:hypothetical protein